MELTRRKFIKGGLGALALYMSAPHMLMTAAQAAEFAPRAAGKKILVLVQLSGGNDGLNMVVPYGLGEYYQLRPALAMQNDKVLHVNEQIGFNPVMSGLNDLYKRGNVAIVQAVGYPRPNRSHFRSIEIWQTAQPDKIGDSGWLGRYLDLSDSGKDNLFSAVNVEPTLPKTFAASKVLVPSVSNVFDFRFATDPQFAADRKAQIDTFKDLYSNFSVDRNNVDLLRKVGSEANKASDYLQRIVRNYKGNVKYPNGHFGDGLKFICQMITGGVNSKIFNVHLDGFDTHTNQIRPQNNLLKQLSEGISAFYADMEQHGLADDVLILTFSEFGRRVGENGSRGTDHGTAQPLLVIGNRVHGGVYGDHPSLIDLDNGDLKYKIDFRNVYATVLEKWLGADSRQILGQQFDIMPII